MVEEKTNTEEGGGGLKLCVPCVAVADTAAVSLAAGIPRPSWVAPGLTCTSALSVMLAPMVSPFAKACPKPTSR